MKTVSVIHGYQTPILSNYPVPILYQLSFPAQLAILFRLLFLQEREMH